MCCKALRTFIRLGCFETLFWKNHQHLPSDGTPRTPGKIEKCCIRAHQFNHTFTFILSIVGIAFAIFYIALFLYLQLPWFAVALPVIELICSIFVLIGNMEKRPWMYWPHFVWNFFLVVLFLLFVLIFLLGGLAYARKDDYAEREAHGFFPGSNRGEVYIYGLLIVLGLFFHAVLAGLYVAFSYRDYIFMRDYVVNQRYNSEDGRVYPVDKIRPLEIVTPQEYYAAKNGLPSYYDIYQPKLSSDDQAQVEQGHHVHYVPIKVQRPSPVPATVIATQSEASPSKVISTVPRTYEPKGKSFVGAFQSPDTYNEKFAKNNVIDIAPVSQSSPRVYNIDNQQQR